MHMRICGLSDFDKMGVIFLRSGGPNQKHLPIPSVQFIIIILVSFEPTDIESLYTTKYIIFLARSATIFHLCCLFVGNHYTFSSPHRSTISYLLCYMCVFINREVVYLCRCCDLLSLLIGE